MPLVDFIDRSKEIHVGGRTFAVRPISVLGMLRAQTIMSEVALSDAAPMADMSVASTEGERAAALARVYLALLDGIGRKRAVTILSLVCAPDDPAVIAAALDSGGEALAIFLGAIADVHNLPRILRALAPRDAVLIPIHVAESEGIGIETVLIDLCSFLPQYSIEDMLAWPYERLLSVQEQVGILRSIRAGVAAGEKKALSTEQLRGAGINSQRKPLRPTLN
jgi:hypothetical protein